jgi:hypothetical protein
MAKDEYADRIESEAELGFQLTDDMLDCHDCLFRDERGRASTCDVYEVVKPAYVLNGEPCEVKRTEVM